MENELLGIYIVIVLCLIVIAMSEVKMAYYSTTSHYDPGSLRYTSAPSASTGPQYFVGSGAAEAPSFWNMGSAQATAAALATAAAQNAADAAANGGKLEESFRGNSYMYNPIGPASKAAGYGH